METFILFLPVIFLFILLAMTVPIYIAIGLSTLIVLVFWTETTQVIYVQRLIGGIDKFSLMAMPLFIYAANIMDAGGISKRILNWCMAIIGHLPGGLAMTTQSSSMFMGALSGSSPATVATIGRIMYPRMIEDGYPKSFSSGLITSSGSVALLIPPSITMIIYANTLELSVGEMFMAGVGAGLLYGGIVLVYILYFAVRHKLPRGERSRFPVIWNASKKAGWSLLIPVIILGGIYFGIFTATESAAISTVYAMLLGFFVYKELSLKKLLEVTIETAVITAQVMILIASAAGFAWLLTMMKIPQLLTQTLTEHITAQWSFLLVLCLLLLIIGMFLDPSPAVVIIGPLVATTAASLGIDAIHLGIVFVTALTIGMFTPPFGLNIFVAQGITGMTMTEMVPGLIRFVIIAITALLIIAFIPQISLYLPNLIYN